MMMGRSKPQGLVGKFFLWPLSDDIESRVEGEVVEQVDPEHYLIRLGERPRLYVVPLKVMVCRLGARGASEEEDPGLAWEFYETREDRERRIAEGDDWDSREGVAKDFTAALLNPVGSERLIDAVRRGRGTISTEELADIAKSARSGENSQPTLRPAHPKPKA